LEFEGTVTQVRLAPEIVSNVVTYTVILKVNNSDLKLKPGMTANVTVITERHEDVLKIAAAALRFTPPTDAFPAKPAEAAVASPLGMPRMPRRGERGRGDEAMVWIVEKGKLVGNVDVGEQGLSDRTWIEVMDTQLKEGQELAVSYSVESEG
jgi:HlyD family secretion protein